MGRKAPVRRKAARTGTEALVRAMSEDGEGLTMRELQRETGLGLWALRNRLYQFQGEGRLEIRHRMGARLDGVPMRIAVFRLRTTGKGVSR